MEFSTGITIALLSILLGGVAQWVMMNNKVTRLETKVERIELDRADTNDRLDEMRQEMKKEYHEITKLIHKIMVKIGITE